ncbi:uncharacterized protein LOC144107038 isoform X4 [Amblyomma americanum]
MPAGAANVSMSAPRLLCMLGRCIQLPVDSAHVGLGAKQWDRRAGTVHQADSAVENCDKCLVGFCLWSSVEVGWPGKRKALGNAAHTWLHSCLELRQLRSMA